MSFKIYKKNTLDNKVVPLMYEVKAFNDAFDWYLNASKQDPVLKSLILESFLLHARILIDFVEDNRMKSTKDDLTCIHFVDINNNKIEGKTVNLKAGIKIALNKHLAHLTTTRLAEKPGWDMDKIKSAINGALKIFINNCADSNFHNDPSMWRLAFEEQLSR